LWVDYWFIGGYHQNKIIAFHLHFHANLFFTGTLGYLMSEVEDGKPLSQVVKSAKSLGYTEPGFI